MGDASQCCGGLLPRRPRGRLGPTGASAERLPTGPVMRANEAITLKVAVSLCAPPPPHQPSWGQLCGGPGSPQPAGRHSALSRKWPWTEQGSKSPALRDANSCMWGPTDHRRCCHGPTEPWGQRHTKGWHPLVLSLPARRHSQCSAPVTSLSKHTEAKAERP